MNSSVTLGGHFCSNNQLMHAYCVLGVSTLLAHNVCLQTNDNHRQGDSNHYFIVLYLFENLEQFYLCHDNDQD